MAPVPTNDDDVIATTNWMAMLTSCGFWSPLMSIRNVDPGLAGESTAAWAKSPLPSTKGRIRKPRSSIVLYHDFIVSVILLFRILFDIHVPGKHLLEVSATLQRHLLKITDVPNESGADPH